MKILLKNNSEQPIYEQIKQQVKENILKGIVAPGEHLPSMRGKGTFVKEQDSNILKEKQFIVIESYAKSMAKEAKTIGMSLSELVDILSLIYEEEE